MSEQRRVVVDNGVVRQKRIYIAGPMRGKPNYNHLAFDLAQTKLTRDGWSCYSPAEEDRIRGFDPLRDCDADHDWSEFPDQLDFKSTVCNALARVINADAIYMLRGWANSDGACTELALAKWLGKEVIFQGPPQAESAPEFDDNPAVQSCTPGKLYMNGQLIGEITSVGVEPRQGEDVLEEALRLTSGARQASYGPPDQDFRRTADAWSALFGWDVTPQQVAMAMIVLKCSRQTHMKKRDNWTDMAGYARCGHLCDVAEQERAHG